MNKRFEKKGFTLIELLVVIAIIGILSSVVLVSLNSSRAKARDAKRLSDIGQIQTALALYLDSKGEYPANVAALVTEKFLPTEPKDPSTDEIYKYVTLSATDLSAYHLGAKLEQSGNTAFGNDKDCNSTAADSCWTGAANTAGFDGTTDATNLYYDVTP